MKRMLASFGAVLLLTLAATDAFAQATTPPASAANDTLQTGTEEAAPPSGPGPTEMEPDTVAAGAATRRARRNASPEIGYYANMGIGSALNYKPDSFADGYDPSLGLMVGGGVRRWGVMVGMTIDYNFFFNSGTTPDDLNILMIFGDIRYVPLKSTARPYLLVCGGYYRQWVVATRYSEDVLGYGAGAGLEMEIDRVKRLFIEGRYIQGRTRETELKSNTEVIPFRLGVTWAF